MSETASLLIGLFQWHFFILSCRPCIGPKCWTWSRACAGHCRDCGSHLPEKEVNLVNIRLQSAWMSLITI